MRLPQKTYKIFFLVLYIFIISFCAYHHEMWRDEADTWLMSRDASLLELFSLMRYKADGLIGYILIMPFAKLGFPYWTYQVIHICIAGFLAFYLLFKSPFNFGLVILLLLSSAFSYEFAVIARNYSIGILFLFVVANHFDKRREHPFLFYPFIILAIFSNLYSAIIAGFIFLLSLKEDICSYDFKNSKIKKIIFDYKLQILVVLSMFLFLFLMWPPEDRQKVGINKDTFWGIFSLENGSINYLIKSFKSIPRKVYSSMIMTYTTEAHRLPHFVNNILYSFVGLIYLILIIKNFHYKKFRSSVFLVNFVFMLFFLSIVRCQGMRHSFHLMIIIILYAWISKPIILNSWWLKFFLFLSMIGGAYTYYLEYRYPFSNSKAMAQDINEMEIHAPIYAGNALVTSTVLPYLKNQKEFFYVGEGRRGSYMTWNANYQLFSEHNKIIDGLKVVLETNTPIYYLSSAKIDRKFKDSNFKLEILARENKKAFHINREVFYFYKISKKNNL